MKRTAAVVMAALAVCGLAACSDDDESGAVEVDGAWARTSPMGVDVGAMYLEVTSPTDDRLVAVTVSPEVAARTEIHETVMADAATTEGTMAGDDSEMGAMTMQQVPYLDLPADETVTLEPGGYHVMMLSLPTPLAAGQTFDATLVFETADPLTVAVEVRDEAP
jgi:periplasmic copper chaperone A